MKKQCAAEATGSPRRDGTVVALAVLGAGDQEVEEFAVLSERFVAQALLGQLLDPVAQRGDQPFPAESAPSSFSRSHLLCRSGAHSVPAFSARMNAIVWKLPGRSSSAS